MDSVSVTLIAAEDLQIMLPDIPKAERMETIFGVTMLQTSVKEFWTVVGMLGAAIALLFLLLIVAIVRQAKSNKPKPKPAAAAV